MHPGGATDVLAAASVALDDERLAVAARLAAADRAAAGGSRRGSRTSRYQCRSARRGGPP
jgi:hypothetical protein